MQDLIPVLAIAIIIMSGVSLLVAIPKPHDAVARVREFSGRVPVPTSVDDQDALAADEPSAPQQVAAPWGNLDFTLFGEEPPSP